MLNEKRILEESLETDRKEMSNLPEGNLQFYKKGNSYLWYVINANEKKKRQYLSKSEIELAKKLAYRGYIKAKIQTNSENLSAINSYINKCCKKDRVNQYLNRNIEVTRLLENRLHQNDEQINDWLQEKYIGTTRNPESLRYKSEAGFMVRSKSEQIIVKHLIDHGIPFKYEDRLFYNGYNIYPDFTVMNPRTHEIYIWEHFGMMDNEDYRNKSLKKINDYSRLGYNLGEKLIITFETFSSGIDEFIVDFYIRHYLL